MSILIAIGLLCIYLNHVACNLETIYKHHATLDEENKYQLYWTVQDDRVYFAVDVETTGWVGLGISTGTGKMVKSDIIMGWVKDGKGIIQDRFADGYFVPTMEEIQDVELTGFKEEGRKTTLEFNRKLVTCDKKDHPIKEGTVRLVWAYGTQDPDTHGPKKHLKTHRGSRSVMLLNQFKGNTSLPDDITIYDFISENVTVPSKRTTYWCTIFKVPDMKGKKHIVMMEPVVQSGNEGIVHHMLLYICSPTFDAAHGNWSGQCRNRNMPRDARNCFVAVLYAWAVGANNFTFPEHVGYPLGESDSPGFLLLEIHYDNPLEKAGMVDSSGVRFHVTGKIRKNNAGLVFSGNSQSRHSLVVPPGKKDFLITGYCPKQCTASTLPPEGMKVFAVAPHTHLAGRSIHVGLIRDGVELPPLLRDDNYDFNFQEYHFLTEEVTILPGDEMKVDCRYSTADRTEVTVGGESTTEEMCYGFMMYYPRNPNLTRCTSKAEGIVVLSHDMFFNTTVNAFIGDFRDISPWTEELTTKVENAYKNSTRVYLSCAGTKRVNRYVTQIPEIDEHWKEVEVCSSRPTVRSSSSDVSLCLSFTAACSFISAVMLLAVKQ